MFAYLRRFFYTLFSVIGRFCLRPCQVFLQPLVRFIEERRALERTEQKLPQLLDHETRREDGETYDRQQPDDPRRIRDVGQAQCGYLAGEQTAVYFSLSSGLPELKMEENP